MTFLIPLTGIVTGILTGRFFESPIWSAAVICTSLAIYLFILKKSSLPANSIRLNSLHNIWILLLFSGIGMYVEWLDRPPGFSEEELQKFSRCRAEVVSSISRATGDCFMVKVTHISDSAGNKREYRNLKIYLTTNGLSASTGDVIEFPARFVTITDNPNFKSNGFAGRMNSKGYIYKVDGNVNGIAIAGHYPTLQAKASECRDRIAAKIENSSLSRPSSELIVAVLLGDKSLLSSETRESFTDAGVAHLLALSGMHVAIIMGIILTLLFPLRMVMGKNWIHFIAVSILWIYAYFSGLAPSTVRACIMATFIVIAMSIERKNATLNALFGSAFIILIADPTALYDAGMQLSFICVGCILAFAGKANTIDRHYHPWLYTINSSMIVSLVATAGTWMLVAHYFHKVPLLFLPANIAMIPLFTPFTWLSLIYVGLLLAGYDSNFLSTIVDGFYCFLESIIRLFSAQGNASIPCTAEGATVILWLTGLFLLALALYGRVHKRVYMVSAAALIISAICLFVADNMKSDDTLIFQDFKKQISVAYYNRDGERVETFNRNASTLMELKGNKIFCIDSNDLSILERIPEAAPDNRKTFLLIGGGCDINTLAGKKELKNFDKIILHSSASEEMEQTIKKEAINNSNYPEVQFLREGPLSIGL